MQKIETLPKTWILVADAKTAQIYTRKLIEKHIPMAGNALHKHIEEVHEVELMPVLEKKLQGEPADIYQTGRNLTGTVFESVGSARHMAEPHIDARKEVKQHFAQEIADLLNSPEMEKAFDRLVLAAPPNMISDIEKHLNEKVRGKVTKKIPKELANLSTQELTKHLADVV